MPDSADRKTPYIDPKLVEFLADRFPNTLPDREPTPFEIHRRMGQVSVVRFLACLCERQEGVT